MGKDDAPDPVTAGGVVGHGAAGEEAAPEADQFENGVRGTGGNVDRPPVLFDPSGLQLPRRDAGLVVGEEPGQSKLTKAQKLGIPLLAEADLDALVRG